MNFDKLLPQILDLAAVEKSALDGTALATAKLSFYDWLVVSCRKHRAAGPYYARFIASEAAPLLPQLLVPKKYRAGGACQWGDFART